MGRLEGIRESIEDDRRAGRLFTEIDLGDAHWLLSRVEEQQGELEALEIAYECVVHEKMKLREELQAEVERLRESVESMGQTIVKLDGELEDAQHREYES